MIEPMVDPGMRIGCDGLERLRRGACPVWCSPAWHATGHRDGGLPSLFRAQGSIMDAECCRTCRPG